MRNIAATVFPPNVGQMLQLPSIIVFALMLMLVMLMMLRIIGIHLQRGGMGGAHYYYTPHRHRRHDDDKCRCWICCSG